MMEWLVGRGREPATWATLVKILKNAKFTALADDVERLVPLLVGGEVGVTGERRQVEGDREVSNIPSTSNHTPDRKA